MATGMFDALNKNLLAEEKAEDQDMRALATMDPFQQAGYASIAGGRMAGQGLARVGAAATGKDTRTNQERMQGAMQALGEMKEGADLSTPAGVDEYYKGIIAILRQHGLFAEAHAAAQEWNKHKNDNADRQVKVDDIARRRAADEAKAANAAEANRIKALRAQQLAQQGMPEFIQVVDRIEREQNPTVRKLLLDRANQQAGGKVRFQEAGDRVIVRNERGEILGVDEIGAKPLNEKDRLAGEGKKKAVNSAYQASMVAAQTDYKAAADLYNHPGLDELIGKWSGLAAERPAVAGQTDMIREAAIARLTPAGQEALALYNQVDGGAFVRALQDLKVAGGGSTGLGQVTEVEGKKITTAKAALFPRQQPASFRRKLADYISVIEQSANILAGKAQEDGLDPIHLNIVELTGPQRGAAPAAAPTAPRAAPRVAPSGDRVRVLRPDGQTGTIPRAKLEEYKRKGYQEIK